MTKLLSNTHSLFHCSCFCCKFTVQSNETFISTCMLFSGNLIQSLLGEDDDSMPSTPMTPSVDNRTIPNMEQRNESQVELD